jgi:hypothetical protein
MPFDQNMWNLNIMGQPYLNLEVAYNAVTDSRVTAPALHFVVYFLIF